MDYSEQNPGISRRGFLKAASVLGVSLALNPLGALAQSAKSQTMRTRTIPATGEKLPVVGLGTWQQFDVASDPELLEPLREVLSRLFDAGGRVIDTSPMYGRAETVLGQLLGSMNASGRAFLATKVWTRGRRSGIRQMNQSMQKLGTSSVDLMQIHNLIDWQTHLRTLREWKTKQKIRYIGVTHYTESAFDELETIMRNHDIDFVQLPYSIGFTRAEKRLLPLAEDRGIAVLVNRPFRAGGLFRRTRGKTLPEWAKDLDCHTWAQFFLKYILGHPAVTCVIPGTSNPDHMLDNARAGMGPLPDSDQRQRMLQYWKSL